MCTTAISAVSSVDVQEKCLVVRYDDRYVGTIGKNSTVQAFHAISIHKSGFNICRRHSEDTSTYVAAAEFSSIRGDARCLVTGRRPALKDGR